MKKVLIIGSGIAGATVAYYLKDKADVTIICKGDREASNSMLAQGGIAAVMQASDRESSHVADTLSAGVFHNQKAAVVKMVHEGPKIIEELISQGMQFDLDASGQIKMGLEGAHSHHRILHAGGDQTGYAMTHFIHHQLSTVNWLEHAFVTDLIVDNGAVIGLHYLDEQQHKQSLLADELILATGGIGHLFHLTSNDATITGDGIAMALRAGCQVSDMEFLQFHPTLLDEAGSGGGQSILISEAVRGAGASLIDESGNHFMQQASSLGDLAPRDVVSRMVHAQLQAGHKIYLDVSKVADFQTQFPSISSHLKAHHINYKVTHRIPVKPGMHFLMGGVRTDSWGRTDLDHLYAVGEVAFTGVHGANRLASNSLLEGLTFAKRVAEAILLDDVVREPTLQELTEPLTSQISDRFRLPSRLALMDWVSESLGIIRQPQKIKDFLAWLAQYQYLVLDQTCLVPEQIETANLCLVAETIARAALKRKESLGAHYIVRE